MSAEFQRFWRIVERPFWSLPKTLRLSRGQLERSPGRLNFALN